MSIDRISTALRRIGWVIALALLLGLRWVLSPEQIEAWYSRGLYLGIREVQGWLSAHTPFPLVYAFLVLLLLYVGWRGWRWWQRPAAQKAKLVTALTGTVNFLAALTFWFLLLWGIQYSRPPLEDQLGLVLHPIDEEALDAEFQWATERLLNAHAQLPENYMKRAHRADWGEYLEPLLQENLRTLAADFGYPVAGPVRSRLLFPRGVLLHFSSSGVYLPWVGEGHVDAGLHPIQWPFVMAHEMGHGLGITDEGNCNLVGFLTCIRSGDPLVEYAGWLGYWRYLAYDYRRICRPNYGVWMIEFPAAIKEDLQAIYTYQQRYPDWMPALRYQAYDTYLKAQGIAEGIQNYDNIILMVQQLRSHPQWRALF